jgi:hypothetical protein
MAVQPAKQFTSKRADAAADIAGEITRNVPGINDIKITPELQKTVEDVLKNLRQEKINRQTRIITEATRNFDGGQTPAKMSTPARRLKTPTTAGTKIAPMKTFDTFAQPKTAKPPEQEIDEDEETSADESENLGNMVGGSYTETTEPQFEQPSDYPNENEEPNWQIAGGPGYALETEAESTTEASEQSEEDDEETLTKTPTTLPDEEAQAEAAETLNQETEAAKLAEEQIAQDQQNQARAQAAKQAEAKKKTDAIKKLKNLKLILIASGIGLGVLAAIALPVIIASYLEDFKKLFSF